jgi:hypothetical protein
MINVATIAVVMADLLAQPINSTTQCVDQELGSECSMTGIMLIRSVDPGRFLIAVDVQPSDGSVDHLFLFAGSTHQIEDTSPFSGSLALDFGAQRAEVQIAGQDASTMDFSSGALAHYWGYGDGARLEYLEELRESYPCDGATGSCWEARGWRIQFPL